MKKIIVLTLLIFALFTTNTKASETIDSTEIPSMTFEDLIQTMRIRQAKVDIIKKNNVQMTELKEELKLQIVETANKINEIKIEVTKDSVVITDETLQELKNLLNILQESKKTLEEDVENTSKEIEGVLDLISTKGMQLNQYDLIIEKQNAVIISMKNIMDTISKI